MPSIFGKAVSTWQVNGVWVASTIPLTLPRMKRKIPTNQGGNRPMSEASKRYQERHKRLGICVRCNRMASFGRKTCRVCLRKISVRWKSLHPLFCHECKELIKPEDRNHKRFHKQCAEKRRARREPPMHRRAVLSYQEGHRKLGLCYNCPRKAFKGGLCRRHYGRVLERYFKRVS